MMILIDLHSLPKSLAMVVNRCTVRNNESLMTWQESGGCPQEARLIRSLSSGDNLYFAQDLSAGQLIGPKHLQRKGADAESAGLLL